MGATASVHDTDCVQFDSETLPEPIERSEPVPPAGWTGGVTVLVQAFVREDGTVGDTRVQPMAPDLDSAAAQCVRRWRFKAATHCGHAKPVWVVVPVRFER